LIVPVTAAALVAGLAPPPVLAAGWLAGADELVLEGLQAATTPEAATT
jgi:hypothetical protein